jgi:hypothetical protein
MPDPRAILLSAVTGEGLQLWLDWLEERRVARAVLDPAARHGHTPVEEMEPVHA